jgi:hypothetical protein
MATAVMDDTKDKIEKGLRLQKLRLNSRWFSQGQDAFAHWIGYSGTKAASNISRIENGERSLPSAKEEAAARVLATDPDLVDDWEYLLGFLRLEHADLRGCLAAHPRFGSVEQTSRPELEVIEGGLKTPKNRSSLRSSAPIAWFAQTLPDQGKEVA